MSVVIRAQDIQVDSDPAEPTINDTNVKCSGCGKVLAKVPVQPGYGHVEFFGYFTHTLADCLYYLQQNR